jgi:hypothetical protein
MEWRRGSSGRVPALQVQSPEFNPPVSWKNKKRIRLGVVMPIVLAIFEVEVGGFQSKVSPGKSIKLYLKNK